MYPHLFSPFKINGLELKNRLTDRFRQSLQQMVSERLADPKFLESLILAIAGEIRDSAKLDESRYQEG